MATTGERRTSQSSRSRGKFLKIKFWLSFLAKPYDWLPGVFRKRLTPLPEINEEPQNVYKEAGRNNASISVATAGISELEQMQIQKSFTRSVIQHPTTIENLPHDLLSNIFIRLLAKQLAQMRCVSKSWKAHLSQPSFVKSHLHHSINNNDRVHLVFYDIVPPRKLLKAFPFLSPFLSPDKELTNFIELPPVNSKSTRPIEVTGSVHGLICFRYGNGAIHIRNPSLSAVSTLPSNYMASYLRQATNFRLLYRRLINFLVWYRRRLNSFRFGYVPNTDDYKVVKLTGICGPPCASSSRLLYVVKEWLQVEVYSMRKGSWKFITQRFPSHVIGLFACDYLCVDGHDGHLHWLGCINEKKKPETIVAFDLGSETFHEIPFPNSVIDDKRSNGLGVLDGKLCVMSSVTMDSICEVWVMEEYGVAESWVKCHDILIPDCNSDIVSVGFTSHNEFLLHEHHSKHHLFLYAPIEKNAKVVDSFSHGSYFADKVIEYVDSLVWVEPTKRS